MSGTHQTLTIKPAPTFLLFADTIRISATFLLPIVLLYFITTDAGYIDALKVALPVFVIGALGIATQQLNSGNDTIEIVGEQLNGPGPLTWRSFYRPKVALPLSEAKHWYKTNANGSETMKGVWCIGDKSGRYIKLNTQHYDQQQLTKFLSYLES